MLNRAARLLQDARHRAGLSQRQLAENADTAQSVVARIELGQTNPTWDTLTRLLDAAGFELRTQLVDRPILDSHMLADIDRILGLTPEERLLEIANMSQLLTGARRV
jgi:transcriptional regulator with XRE-family HTH domain